MSEMFSGWDSLIPLDLSSFNTYNVRSNYFMFNNVNLTSLDLTNFNTSIISNMQGMFNGSKYLISLYLSSFNTSRVKDMRNIFRGCNSLLSLNLSNFDTTSASCGGMFYNCISLKLLVLSNSKFDICKGDYYHNMFDDSNSIISIDLLNILIYIYFGNIIFNL